MAQSDTPPIIEVAHVSKSFRLPHEQSNSLKSLFLNFYRRRTFEQQHTLVDVSFQIKPGEFFGIVGRNGSGKSTLLKLLSGIYSPDSGAIATHGKLTPFIELGVGFNPELTGRENVFLNGALLGFNRTEMLAMYDDIVAFAELERFMDQKLKNYSSGMQVRLAFSIAIRVRSDILILDEVLAVGDEAFQQKCIDVFENYKARKQTVVLVTHDMGVVRRFCSRALLLDKGEIVAIGSPSVVAGKYSKMNQTAIEQDVERSNEASTTGVVATLRDINGKKTAQFTSGQPMHVELSWPATMPDVQHVGVAIVKNTGEYVFGANTFAAPLSLQSNVARYEVTLDIGPGKYHLMLGLFGKTEQEVRAFIDAGPELLVREKQGAAAFSGIARLPHKWTA